VTAIAPLEVSSSYEALLHWRENLTPTRHGPCSVEGMTTLVAMCALLVASAIVMPSWPYSTKWGMVPSASCALAAFGTAALVVFGVL
jgi:hypothetical protein